MKCVECNIEPVIKTKRIRLAVGGYGSYTLVRCPKCGFETGGFEKGELVHWNKLNEKRPHQLSMQI